MVRSSSRIRKKKNSSKSENSKDTENKNENDDATSTAADKSVSVENSESVEKSPKKKKKAVVSSPLATTSIAAVSSTTTNDNPMTPPPRGRGRRARANSWSSSSRMAKSLQGYNASPPSQDKEPKSPAVAVLDFAVTDAAEALAADARAVAASEAEVPAATSKKKKDKKKERTRSKSREKKEKKPKKKKTKKVPFTTEERRTKGGGISAGKQEQQQQQQLVDTAAADDNDDDNDIGTVLDWAAEIVTNVVATTTTTATAENADADADADADGVEGTTATAEDAHSSSPSKQKKKSKSKKKKKSKQALTTAERRAKSSGMTGVTGGGSIQDQKNVDAFAAATVLSSVAADVADADADADMVADDAADDAADKHVRRKRKRKRKKSQTAVTGSESAAATDDADADTTTVVAKPLVSSNSNSNTNNPRPTKKQRKEKKRAKLQQQEQKQQQQSSTSTAVITTADAAAGASEEKKTKKKDKEIPVVLDARVHRLRHMKYIPGSISAMTNGNEGFVAVARTDGSYELKSIMMDANNNDDDDDEEEEQVVDHRMITIAETPPITGRRRTRNDINNQEDDSSSEEEEDDSDDDDDQGQHCTDAATALCWVHPTSSSSSSSSSNSPTSVSSPPVCVGAGPNGNLWIVNFQQANPIHSIVSSGGGGIFDLTTCHCTSTSTTTGGCGIQSLPFVMAACEDGAVRVWRVMHNGEIQDPPLVSLPSTGAPILSVVWKLVHVVTQERVTTYQTVVFAAVADGTIRKYGLEIVQTTTTNLNIDNNNNDDDLFYTVPTIPKSILRMSMESQGRREATKVWSLCLLNDDTGNNNGDTVVSGNSLGQIQFWNSNTGTLLQTVIHSSTAADVLKMVVNAQETKLFASGVDSKIVCLERRRQPKPQHNNTNNGMLVPYQPWKMTTSQRPHTHDVKAMSIVSSTPSSSTSSTSSSSTTETLVTGGLDTKLCSYSVTGFASLQPHTWYPWPCTKSLVSCSTNSNSNDDSNHRPILLSMQRHDSIELYQLDPAYKEYNKSKKPTSKQASESFRTTLSQQPMSVPVGTIRLGDDDDDDDDDDSDSDSDNRRITSSSSSSSSRLQTSLLSPNGKYLAVSNAVSTYVFYLKLHDVSVDDDDTTEGAEEGTGEILFKKKDGSIIVQQRLEPIKLVLPETIQQTAATSFHFVNDDLYVGDSNCNNHNHQQQQQIHTVRLKTPDTNTDTDRKAIAAAADAATAVDDDRMDVDVDNTSTTSAASSTSSKMSMHSVSLPEPEQPHYHFDNDNTDNNGIEDIQLPIQAIQASTDNDGKYLVTMSHSKENAIHIFCRTNNNNNDNDAADTPPQYEHYWTLPSLGGSSSSGTNNAEDISARPAAIALVDGNKLAVATYRSHLYVFQLDSRSLSDWSEQYGFPIKDNNKKWTEDALCDRGYPLRLIPMPGEQQQDRLIMTSFGTFCIIDLSKPMPRRCRNVPRRPAWKNRRKHKAIVHQDDDDDDGDHHNEKKLLLEPRISKVEGDAYSLDFSFAPSSGVVADANTIAIKSTTTVTPTAVSEDDESAATRNCTICSHYKNMLYTDFVAPKEMVVVEQPWLDVAATLPAALQRRIYGAD